MTTTRIKLSLAAALLIAVAVLTLTAAGENAFAETAYDNAEKIDINDTWRGQSSSNIDTVYKIKTRKLGGIYTLKVQLFEFIQSAAPDGEDDLYYNDEERHMLVWLEDAKHSKIKSLDYENMASSEIELRELQTNSLSYKLKPNSTYYIYMANFAWGGEHWVTVNYKPFPVKGSIKKAAAGKKKITVTYNKLKNASRYQVSLKAKGGKWKIYNNKTALKRVFKKLKSGKRYSVKVRGQYRYKESIMTANGPQ